MTTNVLGTNARQDPRQVQNTLKKVFNYNDAGIAAGIAFDNPLPQNAFIENIMIEIVQAFNAGTTNPVTIGTVGPAYNNIASLANAGATGVTVYTAGLGRSLTAAGDVLPYVKYTPTGTAPSTGQGIAVLFYEGGFLS